MWRSGTPIWRTRGHGGGERLGHPLYYVHRYSGLAQHLTAPLYDGTGVYRFSAVVRQARPSDP